MANKTKKDKLNPIYENLTDWKAEYNELREKYQKLIGQHMEAVSLLVLKDKEIDSLNKSIATLETQNRWHICNVPNEDGEYDLPVESGEYIVQTEYKGKKCITTSDYDVDAPGDWIDILNDVTVIQWREMPKPPEQKET